MLTTSLKLSKKFAEIGVKTESELKQKVKQEGLAQIKKVLGI